MITFIHLTIFLFPPIVPSLVLLLELLGPLYLLLCNIILVVTLDGLSY